ncbi:hypothetical protein FBUS_04586 [Fasciolopsis buskii]|uniref:Uncharacterized protein n=1 Tax=Fasciolopsis buskii TaxID=27845 RepID=A0A8E0S133_9TREM|nr:hypothetical protein FBUS_04586 [Fasciolopsis buski]
MPRGKRKCVHPPLTFLYPPFSKQLGDVAYVAPTELHPEVKTANADEKCSWISPTFKLDLTQIAPNRNKHNDCSSPTTNFIPLPKMTLEFVNPSGIRFEGFNFIRIFD